jgi:hypothetical protein
MLWYGKLWPFSVIFNIYMEEKHLLTLGIQWFINWKKFTWCPRSPSPTPLYFFHVGVFGREVGWGDVDWIGLAKDRNRWRALVNSVLNLRVPWNAGKLLRFLTSSGHSSSSQLHKLVRAYLENIVWDVRICDWYHPYKDHCSCSNSHIEQSTLYPDGYRSTTCIL